MDYPILISIMAIDFGVIAIAILTLVTILFL